MRGKLWAIPKDRGERSEQDPPASDEEVISEFRRRFPDEAKDLTNKQIQEVLRRIREKQDRDTPKPVETPDRPIGDLDEGQVPLVDEMPLRTPPPPEPDQDGPAKRDPRGNRLPIIDPNEQTPAWM